MSQSHQSLFSRPRPIREKGVACESRYLVPVTYLASHCQAKYLYVVKVCACALVSRHCLSTSVHVILKPSATCSTLATLGILNQCLWASKSHHRYRKKGIGNKSASNSHPCFPIEAAYFNIGKNSKETNDCLTCQYKNFAAQFNLHMLHSTLLSRQI